MWTQERVHETVEKQRAFFQSGRTLDVNWRIDKLVRLKMAIQANQKELEAALKEDLGRSDTEAYFCDIGSIILEIDEAICGLKKWARPETHLSGIRCFPSVFTKVYKMPYGVTLIISPFNFPFLLSLGVLSASLAGGNTAVIKASSKSKACTEIMQKMIAETFPEEYVTVVDGPHEVADYCLAERFDKIFYTGSPKVARHVLTEAAKNLTPAALELGGETGNWCVIRKDADLKDAARKIAFFKALNSGQVCIDINQVAAAEEIADAFVEELSEAFVKQLGDRPEENPEYPCLITEKAYDACAEEAEKYRDRIVLGGHGNRNTRKYAPTVIYPVRIDEDIVKHELFNPLLPIVTFKDDEADALMNTIASREHGLSFYVFTKDRKWAEKTMCSQQYGGGCINEVCMQLMVKGVPFNGTGHSGMGAYHGEWGFREFTHPSTVLIGSTHLNLPLREHPYTGGMNSIKKKMIKLLQR